MNAKLLFVIGIFFITGCSHNVAAETKAPPHPAKAESTFFAMNTVISVQAYGGDAEKAVDEAEALIYQLEGLWSVTDENSEIYKINHSQGRPVAVSKETEALIRFSLEMAGQTKGVLEPTLYPIVKAWGFTTGEYRIPDDAELAELLSRTGYERIELNGSRVFLPDTMELDLGAVAKGYAGDLLRDLLIRNGCNSAIINLGGNVSLIGGAPRGELWKVGIRNPHGGGNIGVLQAADTNIVTSGNYERYFVGEDGNTYGHIINPKDAWPVENDLLSVTIVHEDGKLCDALSTAMLVNGFQGAVDYWREHYDFNMILITKNDEIYVTEGLERDFSLTQSSQDIPVHIIIPN